MKAWSVTAREVRLACMLVGGVLLFAFGASRLIASQVDQIARAIEHRNTQIVEAR